MNISESNEIATHYKSDHDALGSLVCKYSAKTAMIWTGSECFIYDLNWPWVVFGPKSSKAKP